MKFMQAPIQAVNKVVTVPAPVGGLNVRDSLASMPETDAIVLNNWWPEPYGCRARHGSIAWALNIPGGTGALAVRNASASELYTFGDAEPVAAGEYGIYDISNRQTISDPVPAPVYSGLTNPKPATLQTVNDAGAHLFFISGNGGPVIVKNDAGFTTLIMDSGPPPGSPADDTWYGGPGANTRQMTSHQGRLWATDCASSVGWYLPVDAIQGEWKPFDFGPQMTLGGSIWFITTWTIDDGNGAEDHLVVVTTAGQAIVYGGTDPSTIETWSLVGVYTVGEPVGGPDSCFVKVGGDLILLTQQGLVSMAMLLISTKVNNAVNAVNSSKVQLLISTLATQVPNGKGWQTFFHPPSNLFIINVPPANEARPLAQRQLAANLVTSAVPWTAFSDIPALMWAAFDNMPYFGTSDGRVYRAWTGWEDEVDLEGNNGMPIATQAQQAYSYLDAPAIQKQVGMYRPGFLVDKEIIFGSVIEYDFRVRRLRVPNSNAGVDDFGTWALSSSPAITDGIWDKNVWAGGIFPYRRWIQATGIGSAVSLRIVMASSTDTLWVATDYSYKLGSIL